ncbi:MAG: hypothetical protein L6Q80_07995 [Dehalococcoidia bacterium]|nr:hypothetical protein [Dehalococcoidia bacterium]RIL02089.1 MAG: hypothetical protein DCC78_08430 [bacterium]
MQIVSREQRERRQVTGRLSDGSDRMETVETRWAVTVSDVEGRLLALDFDHDPTDQEVLDALPRPRDLAPTRRDDIEALALSRRYGMFVMWRDLTAEAQARGEPATIVNAAKARADASWLALKQSLNDWRNAT